MRYQEAIDRGIFKSKKWYRIPNDHNSYKLTYCDKCKQRCFVNIDKKGRRTFCSVECHNTFCYKEDKKKCSRCKNWLPLDNFYYTKKGYNPNCIECEKKRRSTPEYREQVAKYERKKRKEDDRYRIAQNMSRIMRKVLNGGKEGKGWEECVDYTREELIDSLVSKFLPGMTLENYGEWHIDHKIPVAYFNFSSPEDEDFKKCFALENLQPLWAEDNLKKGSKLPDDFNE